MSSLGVVTISINLQEGEIDYEPAMKRIPRGGESEYLSANHLDNTRENTQRREVMKVKCDLFWNLGTVRGPDGDHKERDRSLLRRGRGA